MNENHHGTTSPVKKLEPESVENNKKPSSDNGSTQNSEDSLFGEFSPGEEQAIKDDLSEHKTEVDRGLDKTYQHESDPKISDTKEKQIESEPKDILENTSQIIVENTPQETSFPNLEKLHTLKKSTTMLLPKNIDVEFGLFIEDDYKTVDVLKENITSTIKLKARVQNKIRWRKNKEGGLESNSKLVEWEDGSRSLLIGNEYYDLVERDLGETNSMVFYEKENAKELIKIGNVEKEISLIPIVTTTNMAEKLIENSELKRKKSLKETIILDNKDDPEKLRKIELQNERAKIKLQRKIERNQQKRKSNSQRSRNEEEKRYEPGLSAEFLETEE